MKGKKRRRIRSLPSCVKQAELNSGSQMGQVCKKLAISEQTFHRWRNQYGGMKSSAAKRLKELEEENRRLKRRWRT